MNKQVILKPMIHREQECIAICFHRDPVLHTLIQKNAGAKWSKTQKTWWVPLSQDNYHKLCRALKEKATIDKTQLLKYLQEKKEKGKGTTALTSGNQLSDIITRKTGAEVAPLNKVTRLGTGDRIHPVNAHVLPAMRERLKLKAYSPSTIKTYINEMAQLLKILNNIPADELTPEHLRRYMVFCLEKLGLTEFTLHSRINAMKFYFEQVLKKQKFFWEIPRPKKQFQLPRFFNQDEITAIIKAAGNLKHKTMLMLSYGAGLRVSEVVKIKTIDIDSKRMCIMIRQAKGKKDRMVSLSPVLLVMLREYWKKYKPLKDGYLFPGQNKEEPYSSRSLQLVLADAKKKAGVLKPGSIHALRHSFATHLLDKGTDVTMIMKLLGHNSIRTTLRYLHVTNRDMLQVMSPLDDLLLE